MEVAVLDIQGKPTGRTIALDESVFGVEPNEHAVWLDVKQYLANKRQGTHASKHRGLVSGSTRKLKKQKGTGGARAGSIKSPVFRGGGRVFGPEPRDYSFKLNKKLKRLARKSALSQKVSEQNLIVVEDFTLNAPKTKDFVNLIAALGLNSKKSLFVTAAGDKNVYLSSRNLQYASVVPCTELNTYEIINNKALVVCEGALEQIQNNLSN